MIDDEPNRRGRVVFFGICSGLIWSLVPGVASETLLPPGQGISVVAAGMITGVAISFAVSPLLTHASKVLVIVLAVYSLPIGAFIFGLTVSYLQSPSE